MKKNMGTTDRFIRTTAAITIGFLYVAKAIEGVVGALLLFFAAIFVFTSLSGSCPVYSLFGFHTNKKTQEN